MLSAKNECTKAVWKAYLTLRAAIVAVQILEGHRGGVDVPAVCREACCHWLIEWQLCRRYQCLVARSDSLPTQQQLLDPAVLQRLNFLH